MKLDNLDRHLLYLLDQNSRAPPSELAHMLGRSRETIEYRIRNLVRRGVVRSFVVVLDLAKLGLVNYAVYLKLNNLDTSKHELFINEMSRRGHVIWLASLGGRFDFVIEMPARSPFEFDSRISDLLEDYSADISDHHVAPWISQYTLGKKYLWPEQAANKPPKPVSVQSHISERPYGLDDLDRKILQCLANDARISLAELGRRIRVPPTTVSFRLKQLERSGIITGYTTFQRAQTYGYTRFKALISSRNFTRKDEIGLLAFCSLHPNIYFCGKTIGSWDFEIEVEVPGPQEYQRFLVDFRSRFDDIINNLESLSVFEEHKLTFWSE